MSVPEHQVGVPRSAHPFESTRDPGGHTRTLLATSDAGLLDDLLRLAAAAGVDVEVAPDASAARRSWNRAPLVVLGSDVLADLRRWPPPRRTAVVLVGLDLDDASIWERAVELGAEQVVFLPDAEQWLVGRLADGVQPPTGLAPTVCVLGGRGGAGASTLAAALALTATRQGLRAFLVDADPLGGGIDLMLGGENVVGLRWPDLASARGRVSGSALREQLPRVEDLTVLSWDRGDALSVPPDAMQAILAGARSSSDVVVVDVPRHLDEAAQLAMAGCDVALLVVPAEVRAAASAARVAAAARLAAPDVRVVVRGPAPSGLTGELVAESLGLPLAGDLRAEPGLAAALERGEPPARRGRGPLATFCSRFLAEMVGRHRAAA